MEILSRSAFFALDGVAQASHIRGGGRVVDDPPVVDPYRGLRLPMDGKARLAAIQAHDAMTKRIADENSAIDRELAEAKATLARWQSER